MSDQPIELDESIFDDDIEIDEIPDNPNHLPEDIYICRVTEATLKPTAKGDKIGLTIKYQIIEGDYASAFPFTEWLWAPRKTDPSYAFSPDEKKANARIKQHYIAMGFGADEMRKVKPQDLIGRELKVRTRNKKDNNGVDRVNVTSVAPIEVEGSSEGLGVFSKAADDI